MFLLDCVSMMSTTILMFNLEEIANFGYAVTFEIWLKV